MSTSRPARELWSRTRLFVWPERYLLVSLPLSSLREVARLASGSAAPEGVAPPFAALLAERDEVSLTIEQQRWASSPLRGQARSESGPWRVITLDIDLDLDVVGYLAEAAHALAAAGISIVPQCAFSKDHLLVQDRHLESAVRVLEGLIESCRRST